MALKYDFDMGSVMPDSLQDQFGGMFDNLSATGVQAEQTAMFRDPQTVAALSKADQAVRTFFLESGFGLQIYDSGAPPDLYPASDEVARVAVIKKLTANLATHDLAGANWGSFVFTDFLEALDRAKPLEDETLLAPTPHTQRAAPPRAPASKVQSRRGLALAGLAAGLMLLIYAAIELIL
jgi:hypothetical protein